MSWQATAYISELTITPTGDKLTRSEKLLALLLANRHNPDYDIAWPSVTKLAAEALLSERRTRDFYIAWPTRGSSPLNVDGSGLSSARQTSIASLAWFHKGVGQFLPHVGNHPQLDISPGWGNHCCPRVGQ